MENEEFDAMTMSTLDTFDIVTRDEYDRDALETLDVQDDELLLSNDISWNFPSFNDASRWIDNMDMVDEMMNKDKYDVNLLYKGKTFSSKEAVIHACQRFSVLNRVEFYTKKSDPTRLVLICREAKEKMEGVNVCQWYVRAIPRMKTTIWEITQFNDKHTCEKDIIPKDNPHFNKLYIATEVSDLIREKLRLAPRHIKQLMFKKYEFEITNVKAWKVRQKALEILFGTWTESFSQLPYFLNALIASNPGSYVNLQMTPLGHGKSSVDRVFWAFAPAIQAFQHCRPVLSVDGKHLY